MRGPERETRMECRRRVARTERARGAGWRVFRPALPSGLQEANDVEALCPLRGGSPFLRSRGGAGVGPGLRPPRLRVLHDGAGTRPDRDRPDPDPRGLPLAAPRDPDLHRASPARLASSALPVRARDPRPRLVGSRAPDPGTPGVHALDEPRSLPRDEPGRERGDGPEP